MNRILLFCLIFLSAQLSTAQPGSGHMLEFNGSSSYVNCGTINLSGNALTLQGWVYVDQFKSSFPYITSFIGTEQSGHQAAVRFGDASLAANKAQFILYFGSYHTKLDGNMTLDSDRWYHVAATYDGSSMKLYINGVLDASNSQSGNFTSNSTFELGRNYGNGRILNGSMDEMSVFNTALSQATIRDWMCRRITSAHPNYNNLVGYWPLDDATGTTATDQSGNNYNGSLVSSPSWEISGAPIGDVSKHTYASSFSIGLSHPDGDSIHIDYLNGNTDGIHLYRIDSVPYDTTALPPLLYLDTSRYWGVFPVGDAAYEATYYYGNNSFIGTNDECFIGFANRDAATATQWDNVFLTEVDYTNEWVSWADSGRSENILAMSANGPHAFSFDHALPLCHGDTNGTITAHTVGGQSPYTYSWSNGSSDSVANNLSSGMHHFTVTDNFGCVSNDSTYLDQPTPVGGEMSSSNATCLLTNDGSVSVAANGGTGSGYTYYWSNAVGSTTATVTGLFAGTYYVTITDANGCTGIDSITLESTGPDPIPDLGADTNICGNAVFGLTAKVTNGPATDFLWSTGETGPIKVVNVSGTYSLTVTNAAGCMGVDSIEVTYVTPQQVSLPSNGSGIGSYTINASAGFSQYSWSNGETGQSITVSSSGQYAVTATDSNGCTSADTIDVSITPVGIGVPAVMGLRIYPNPFQQQFTITMNDPSSLLGQVQVLDLAGRVVFTFDMDASKQRIDLTALQNGIYQVQGTTTNGSFSVSVVKN